MEWTIALIVLWFVYGIAAVRYSIDYIRNERDVHVNDLGILLIIVLLGPIAWTHYCLDVINEYFGRIENV
jgi:hypothetical protein